MDEGLVLFFLIVIGGLLILYIFNNNNRNSQRKDGKIDDKDVKFSDVCEYVENFIPECDQKLKSGYTEKSIENQLAKYLKKRYVTVTQQHGVADKNARQIDIDVANGVAGIELKDVSKVIKTAEFDRLNGQLSAYLENRYTKNNLILVICGELSFFDDSKLQDVIKLCKKLDVKLINSIIKSNN